jgi:hypothetical protein
MSEREDEHASSLTADTKSFEQSGESNPPVESPASENPSDNSNQVEPSTNVTEATTAVETDTPRTKRKYVRKQPDPELEATKDRLKCSLCDYTTTLPGRMNRHIKKHQNEKT